MILGMTGNKEIVDQIEKIKKTVLEGIQSKKKNVQLIKWMNFLDNELEFPFNTIIEETENFELKRRDIVVVKEVGYFDEIYGLLVEIKKGRRKFIFPLCDLEIIEKQSKNYVILEAFSEWWTEKYL